MPSRALRLLLFATTILCTSQVAFPHNGKVGYAYPVKNITVDGNLSDWPKNAAKYLIDTHGSETKANNDSDFSGFFHVGYLENEGALLLAFSVTDDNFIEDTTDKVSFNTQDGLELCLDIRHLPFGSGVASFMYSKKLRNVNKAHFDAFAKNASWDMMEVAMKQDGKTRYYEWKIRAGNDLKPGRSVGLDFQVFDKDSDGSFSFSSWGKGAYKFRDPKGLGDVLLMPEKTRLSTVSGHIRGSQKANAQIPQVVRFTSTENPAQWLQVTADSTGEYRVILPAGTYNVNFIEDYYLAGDTVYSVSQKKPVKVKVNGTDEVNVPEISISIAEVPHLVPPKGILHNFRDGDIGKIDHFIKTYQKYYDIPGVSLAVIKDGSVIYHQTYGVRNSFTGQKVDNNTLFEAASITKPVFAFAVQRLAERGLIDLDKPLYQYLPYADIAHDDRYKLMTARHVLTHRTGFPNWRSMNADGKLNLLFTPGTKYNYSGEGFEYLKLVVEKITGKKVEQVLREEVLGPVGLYHTFFSANDSLRKMAATGHYDMLPNLKELPREPGMAWSMFTEAKAFTKFMLYLLEQKGMNEQSYNTMLQKQSEYEYDPGDRKPLEPTYMGMSLEIRETPVGLSFGHGGNNGDFKCRFEVFKDLKMGYVVFTNSNTSNALLEALGKFLIEGTTVEGKGH
jgi:CubicO group peptidase (beta-lactamase class C family)